MGGGGSAVSRSDRYPRAWREAGPTWSGPEVLSASPLPPSGWDAEAGGDEKDAVQPDVLVSFAAPKSCSCHFSGRHHFVAGRFVPDDVRRKFGLHLPKYTGTDCVASL